jgi:hypothetical protein
MKRVLLSLFLISISAAAFAQNDPISSMDAIADGLQAFTNTIAPSIPLNSTTGNIWSDAYIGQLIAMPPHVGVGEVLGLTFIPGSAISQMLSDAGGNIPGSEALSLLAKVGVPIPALVTQARIGGFILPFDIGMKFGSLPNKNVALSGSSSLDVSYLLVGGDVRYALLDEKKNVIDLSIGLSLNYLKTALAIPTGMGTTTYEFTLPTDPIGAPAHTLSMSEPKLFLGWESFSADLTAQVSKKIIFFTPYAGAGLTIGKPVVKTGIKSELTYDGTAMTTAQMEQLQQLYDALKSAGMQTLPIDPSTLREGYIFKSNTDRGTDLRVYGGFALDIWVVRLDTNIFYSFFGRNYGANFGARIQL